MKHTLITRGSVGEVWLSDAQGVGHYQRVIRNVWRYCTRCGCSEGMIERMGWSECDAPETED